jgi:hypothetical protein
MVGPRMGAVAFSDPDGVSKISLGAFQGNRYRKYGTKSWE